MSLNPINTNTQNRAPQSRAPQTPRPSSVGETRPEKSTLERTREINTRVRVNNLTLKILGKLAKHELNRKQQQSRQP